MKLAVQDNMVPGRNLLEKLQKMEDYGFEGVEVWGRDMPRKFEELKSALSSSRISFSTVCGFTGDLLGPDKKTRLAAINTLKEMLSMCGELGGVGVITVPTFGPPKVPDLYPWLPDVEKIEKRILVEELKILGRHAEDVGANIILEPLNRYETHFMRRLEHAVEICVEVGMDHVKMMADFFHMNIEEANIPSSLEAAADFLVHVHLADSNRVLPGYGHMDFKEPFEALKRIGYKNFMALECRIPGNPEIELPKCVRYLKRFL